MVAVHEITWEEASAPGFEKTHRTAFRAAVDQVAINAKTALPECNGRIEKAVAIVLAGDVELLAGGHARVRSQCQGRAVYHLTNGACDCKDYQHAAPSGWCKHRIAAGLFKRATALVTHTLTQRAGASNGHTGAQEAVPAQPTNGMPSQHLVFIQGKPFVRYAGLLQMAHERGLTALTADWTFNSDDLSLAHAVATFQDGRRFEESGDATPANTNRKVAPHFRRVALTRAKARVLRDALGVDLVAIEELADNE
jgi:hypothetical protein